MIEFELRLPGAAATHLPQLCELFAVWVHFQSRSLWALPTPQVDKRNIVIIIMPIGR